MCIEDEPSISNLSPAEIVALTRRRNNVCPNGIDYVDSIDEAVAVLPEVDLPLARSTHLAFQESALVEDNLNGAGFVHELTRLDHDFGLELLHRYIRHREPTVRHNLRQHIWIDRQHAASAKGRILEATHITWPESDWLLDVASRTERGELPHYDLGGIAVARYLNDVDPVTGIGPDSFPELPSRVLWQPRY